MKEFVEISAQNLYKAVYDTCFQANIYLSEEVYDSLCKLETAGFEPAEKMAKIHANAAIAAKNQRPLCQDTGQVVIFLEIGDRVTLDEGIYSEIINKAVSDCYCEKFFRKSIVKDAIFTRKNTSCNAPAVIYTEVVRGDKIKIGVIIKGGGSENMSQVAMLTPSATEQDIINYVANVVLTAGENACPPMFLGIGIGGTLDMASVLSKKAFLSDGKNPQNHELTKDFSILSEKIKKYINSISPAKVADVKLLSTSTHIACLPVCVTVNCHSTRHASVLVDKDGYKILTKFAKPENYEYNAENQQEINTSETEKLKELNEGDEILLSGTIYTARDMAHKRLVEMINRGENLPFELKNSIIFYAGPCPAQKGEIIGPVGPTTSKRMDKFAPVLYDKGLLATIGKGLRSDDVKNNIRKNNALYFSVQGGVASLLQNCVKASEIVAFEDLGAEAIYKLKVEKLPVKLELK